MEVENIMNLIDIVGSVMVGPSSSHTAGAVRIGKIAPLLSDPIFSYGNVAYQNYFDETGTTLRYMSYIIWDKLIEAAPLKKPISEYPVLESCECVCTSTTGHENGIIDIDINAFMDYCSQHNYEHYGYYYAFYSYSVPDKDKIVDYYKLYFPIKK